MWVLGVVLTAAVGQLHAATPARPLDACGLVLEDVLVFPEPKFRVGLHAAPTEPKEAHEVHIAVPHQGGEQALTEAILRPFQERSLMRFIDNNPASMPTLLLQA